MTKEDEKHWVGKIAQKAIIQKDDKILLIRDPREPRIIWELPGGRLDSNEIPAEGLKRELREELGVEIEPGAIVYTEPYDNNGPHIGLVYTATLVDPEKEFVLQKEEICETKWASREEIENLLIYPEHKRALETFFKIEDK